MVPWSIDEGQFTIYLKGATVNWKTHWDVTLPGAIHITFHWRVAHQHVAIHARIVGYAAQAEVFGCDLPVGWHCWLKAVDRLTGGAAQDNLSSSCQKFFIIYVLHFEVIPEMESHFFHLPILYLGTSLSCNKSQMPTLLIPCHQQITFSYFVFWTRPSSRILLLQFSPPLILQLILLLYSLHLTYSYQLLVPSLPPTFRWPCWQLSVLHFIT